jgi:hypothetical protein
MIWGRSRFIFGKDAVLTDARTVTWNSVEYANLKIRMADGRWLCAATADTPLKK